MFRRFSMLLLLALVAVVAPLSPLAPQKAQASPCTMSYNGQSLAGPAGFSRCTTVRPGQPVTSPHGGCTLNFVFAGSDGHRYIGTAGHCILGGDADGVVFASPGPEAKVFGQRIGEFAYATLNGSRDFALIRVDPAVAVDPEMAHFGGPTAVYTDHSGTPVVLHHYGVMSAAGTFLPARSAVARVTTDTRYVQSYGAAVWGDSGSAVIDSKGRAVGVLVHLGGGITRIDHQLPFAAAALGTTLTLQTAPFRSLASV